MVGPPRRRIGKRYWRGSSGANSRPPRPRALLFRAKPPRSFAIFMRLCASLRCRSRKRKGTMSCPTDQIKTRRKFLKMLSASPLLASPGFLAGSFANLLAAREVTGRKLLGWLDSYQQNDEVISSPDHALDVMDFELAARKTLPPAHFGYLATGVDDDGTVRANREGYSRIQIRARRLVDVENIDMSVRLFGTTWSSPILICPISSQKAFHQEGDIAVARAADAKDHLQ